MRLVGIACARNESDVIEAFVRHNARVVDHLVVLDAGSTDGTLDILLALEKEGLPLEIVQDASPGKYQWLRMSRLMRDYAATRYGAEWVLPLDADEFYVGRAEGFDSADAAIPRILRMSTKLYGPTPGDDPGELNPAIRIRRRLADDRPNWAKVIIPSALARSPDAILDQGNHDVLLNGHPCRSGYWEHAYLAHVPVRSEGQCLAKTAVTTLQYLAMGDSNLGGGVHYLAAFAELKRDPTRFASRHAFWGVPVAAGAMPVTIEDPIPYLGGPLVYTRLVDDSVRALLAVLTCAEELAVHYAQLRGGVIPQEPLERVLAGSVIRRLQAGLDERDQLIEEIWRSWIWRVGRLLVGPAGWFARHLTSRSP
jgi:hypothetical protein